jgi:putative glutamine amidotransferase
MSKRFPRIGVTLDAEPPADTPDGYSRYPWYALRQNYSGAIEAAGGVPLALPHNGLAEQYLDIIDALVITGGGFDVDPSMYGETSMHDSVTLKPARTIAEMALLQGALKRNIPVLGICGGEQLLAVVLGGTLIQHIPDSIENCLNHRQHNPRHEPGHEVSIVPGTMLHRIVGVSSMAVNTSHHQAVRSPGPHAVVNATTSDGVIEGIEDARYKFCLGVQWHPEFHISPGDRAIFDAMIAACT